MKRLIQIQLDAPDDQIARACAVAAARGCTAMELACAVADLSDAANSHATGRLVQWAEHAGLPGFDALVLTDLHAAGLTDADANVRAAATCAMERAIEAAARLGAGRLSIAPATVCDSDPSGVAYQDALNRTFDALQLLAGRAQRCGVRVALCAAKRGFLMSPPELRELINRLNSHTIGADLDCHNRDDRAATQDWISTLGNLTIAIGISASASIDLDSVESEFQRHAPAAIPSAHAVIRP